MNHALIRARWIVLVLFVGLCAWLVPGIGALQHDDDVLAFLPPDHPDVVAFHEIADRFGMLEVGLVGLRADDGGDLLQPERVAQVRALGRAVAALPGVRLVLSFPDLPDPQVRGETLVVQVLVPEDLAPDKIRQTVLSNRNAVGNLISEDGTAAAMLVYMLHSGGDNRAQARGANLAAIRSLVGEQWSGEAFFGGAPFIEDTAASSSRTDIQGLSPIVIAVLAVASALLLGSATGAGLNLIVTGLGVALVVGAHGRFGEPFTIVSSTTPVMMVALGGAFGMHIISGYQRQKGTPPQRASAALRELWLPVVLSGVTTATAFFALYVMPQVPMQRFGIVAGFGVLLLLLLALGVLPALLALLPAGLLRQRTPRRLPLRALPPAWAALAIAVVGVVLGLSLEADPDTRNVFDKGSEPHRADVFFNDHFGGSQFIQIAVEADLNEPTVLREIRELSEQLAAVEGVADVRSMVEPVALVNEGFGGRHDVPSTAQRALKVVSSLAHETLMSQLMTSDSRGAIVHVKLSPLDSDALVEVTRVIRGIVAAMPNGSISVGAASDLAAARLETVRARVGRVVGRQVAAAELSSLASAQPRGPALLDEVVRLRERAFGTDEVVKPVPPEEYEALDPEALVEPRGEALEAIIRGGLPTLVKEDPEGIKYAAEQLGTWIDEAIARLRTRGMCDALGIEAAGPEPEPADDSPAAMLGFTAGGPAPLSGPCKRLLSISSELEDTEWVVPAGSNAPVLREVPVSVRITGQPIIGQAFAQSVRKSLRSSTAVSWFALALVLALSRQLRALVPATWTLAVTAGVIAMLGHSISIGTSMVSCIALGAGVDFAIHLGIRARRSAGGGREAVDDIGAVILFTGIQLALAFLVLLASGMPPLREFGVGLAIGLLGAAAGAVWLTPRLFR